MERLVKSLRKSESGEVMLESSIILVSVLILLMILLSLCFMFYQQAVMTSIANELSSSLAKNYKYHTTDSRTDTFTVDDAKAQKKYRLNLGAGKMEDLHEAKAEPAAQKRFELTSFGFNSKGVTADCEVKISGVGRAYIKVTVTNKTDFFLSDILKWAGIIDDNGFSAVSYAEITDMTGYASTVNFADYVMGGLGAISGVGKIYVNLKSIMDGLLKLAK